MTDTFYWHDYETWGVNPAQDRPAQFAGIRTDSDFNVIGEPLNIFCKPALDTLPQAGASLVTGISPQQAAAEGVSEREFFNTIHAELARPQTCGVGYNSIRFDDEVTRFGFYRNFIDPYAREWQSGCSRWDIIDMVRLCYAVRPEGIEWPVEEGRPSFRLEKLTAANGIAHEGAHDALSDVYATIELAQRIRQQQPKLYQHVLDLRPKARVQSALELGSFKPKLHVSSKFGTELASTSIILPVAVSPSNRNEIICVDLRYSPAPLLDCSVEELGELRFTPLEQLPEGIERIPLKSVHLNRCPIVLSPGLVDDTVAERTRLDLEQVEAHRQQLISAPGLVDKLVAVYGSSSFAAAGNDSRDVDAQLYGGFIPNSDRSTVQSIPSLTADALAARQFVFEDPRLGELLFRYRARNFSESLSREEQQRWGEHCHDKLLAGDEPALIAELQQLPELKKQHPDKLALLDELENYLSGLRAQLQAYAVTA